MMTTWVLVLMVLRGPYDTSQAITTVSGFHTLESCEKAARKFYGPNHSIDNVCLEQTP